MIAKIAQKSGQSGEWNVKALLLLAKNYYALNDAFQAVFVLESIIENFDSFPLIVQEASELIETYRASLSEENRSITKETNNE